ncbi:hypothetical protein [Cryptosporangium aurantiacum]|uniref:Uncharacterized protein n=1 Tax=Cryptosporangium aurantiacum TaxID=134849 RepID=A0A1M7PTI7_9ACTN|nr:hypothetical protein [Cryptosporangium aurantiacum]SHN20646.1 hypothetical protein SAMN05443668_103658 [Cryptosporangium aurantiacum]
MTQQMFDDLIGEPPPSTVDVDRIVRRVRRVRMMQRSALAFIVVALVATGASYFQTGTQSAAPPVAADTRFRLVVDTEKAAEASGARLSEAYDEALQKAAPGFRWREGHPPVISDREAKDLFTVTGSIDYQGRSGLLLLRVEGPYDPGPCKASPAQCAEVRDAVENDAVRSLTCTKDGDCVSRKGPQGQAMTVRHWRFSAEADYTEVRIALPEKRVLILEAHNQVLTKDQLIDVVSDLAEQIK